MNRSPDTDQETLTVLNALTLQANPTFRFVIEIDNNRQAAFTECALPSIEWEMEEVKEGGLNSYVHQLPGRRKAATLSLKNGIAKCELLKWYIQALEMGIPVIRKCITVILLGSKLQPLLTWQLFNAYPTKWTAPQLKTDDNTIAIQTLEIACEAISVSLPVESEQGGQN